MLSATLSAFSCHRTYFVYVLLFYFSCFFVFRFSLVQFIGVARAGMLCACHSRAQWRGIVVLLLSTRYTAVCTGLVVL